MRVANRFSLPRRQGLALALLASALQVLSCSLPSRVLCCKGGSLPQVEYFSVSCSCREAHAHSGFDHDRHGAARLEAGCRDIFLPMPAALVSRAPLPFPAASAARGALTVDHPAAPIFRLVAPHAFAGCGPPLAWMPPPLAVLPLDSSRRC